MKYVLYLTFLASTATFGASVFDTPKHTKVMDTSMFEKTQNKLNKEAQENPKIKCRKVCDKKLYREQQIKEAIDFYKKQKSTHSW